MPSRVIGAYLLCKGCLWLNQTPTSDLRWVEDLG